MDKRISFFAILILLFTMDTFCLLIPGEKISIDIPSNWTTEVSSPPIILISKSQMTESSPKSQYTFQSNLVVSKQVLTKNQKQLYEKDPAFYLQVVLYQSYPTMSLLRVENKNINGINGIYMQGSVKQSGLDVSNLLFYFILENTLYGIAYSSLSHTFVKNLPTFETSLHSLKNRP
jgi:hypothetical protein